MGIVTIQNPSPLKKGVIFDDVAGVTRLILTGSWPVIDLRDFGTWLTDLNIGGAVVSELRIAGMTTLTNLNNLLMIDPPQFYPASIPGAPVDVTGCSGLSVIELTTTFPISFVGLGTTICSHCNLWNCNLTQSEVDDVLAGLVEAERWFGLCDVSGGTSSPPSAAYLTMSGNLSPDVTGDYVYDGDHNGYPSYTKDVGGTAWYIAEDGNLDWYLSTNKGQQSNPGWKSADAYVFGAGTYGPIGGSETGTGTSTGPFGGFGMAAILGLRGWTVSVNS